MLFKLMTSHSINIEKKILFIPFQCVTQNNSVKEKYLTYVSYMNWFSRTQYKSINFL